MRILDTALLIAVLAMLVACSHGAGGSNDEQLVRVIVQAPSTDQAERAVGLVGGTVTHRLGIIRSVGATVTDRQLERLSEIEGVQVHEDRAVALNKDEVGEVSRAQVGTRPSVRSDDLTPASPPNPRKD